MDAQRRNEVAGFNPREDSLLTQAATVVLATGVLWYLIPASVAECCYPLFGRVVYFGVKFAILSLAVQKVEQFLRVE